MKQAFKPPLGVPGGLFSSSQEVPQDGNNDPKARPRDLQKCSIDTHNGVHSRRYSTCRSHVHQRARKVHLQRVPGRHIYPTVRGTGYTGWV